MTSKIGTTVHLTSDSRVTDGGRIYWKHTVVFMWKKPRRMNITTHSFNFPEWVGHKTIVEAKER